MIPNPPEHDPVASLMSGNAWALEEIMSTYQTRVFHIAYGIVRNHHDAQEVTQDVFLTAARKIDMLRSISSFPSWIFRITVNESFMKLRKRRTDPRVEPGPPADGDNLASLADVIRDRRKSADEELYQSEFMQQLETALQRMPPKYREVFRLRDLQEYSNEEAGKILNLSRASIKSRLHRARSYLRSRIGQFSYAMN